MYALISNDSFFYLFVINGGVFLFHGKVVYIYMDMMISHDGFVIKYLQNMF